MEKQPLISVIVPVYNVEAYIRECVDSIKKQTYTNLEIILVDDGSSDCSGAICDEYAVCDYRIKVFHKENGGQASARNYGLDQMHGEYVGFVDSDDWIESDMIEYLYNKSVEYSADIVTCNICPQGQEMTSQTFEIMNMEAALCSLMKGGGVSNSVCDKLFAKNVLLDIRFPEDMIMEDAATVYQYILNSNKVVVTDRGLYHYRIREGSTLHSAFSLRNFDSVKATKLRLDTVSTRYPHLKQVAADGYIWTALYCIWWADHAAHGKYDSERSAIAAEMLNYLQQNEDVVISGRVTKIKIFLLRVGGVRLHDLVWNSYHKLLGILNK